MMGNKPKWYTQLHKQKQQDGIKYLNIADQITDIGIYISRL